MCCKQENLRQKPASLASTQIGGTHYKGMTIEPVEIALANNLDALQFSGIKYIMRHKLRHGAEDLKKAIHFALIALEMQYGMKAKIEFNSGDPKEDVKCEEIHLTDSLTSEQKVKAVYPNAMIEEIRIGVADSRVVYTINNGILGGQLNSDCYSTPEKAWDEVLRILVKNDHEALRRCVELQQKFESQKTESPEEVKTEQPATEVVQHKSRHQILVEDFMRKARQDLPESTCVPNRHIRQLRAKLILEEAVETVEALGFSVVQNPTGDFSFIADREPDLLEIIDGCCDIKVVTTGTLSACGVPDLPFQECVDLNNLAKFGPGHSWREDGKLIKPEGHKPPDIAGVLTSLNQ